MIRYALKRITRSGPLFAILFFGVLISSTMFATITLGTNELFLGMIDKALEEKQVDMKVGYFINKKRTFSLEDLENDIGQLNSVRHTEIITRVQRHDFEGPRGTSNYWEAYVGIEKNSLAYNGITVLNGNSSLGPNQVWLVNSSTRRIELKLLDEINITFTVIQIGADPEYYSLNFTLQIAGFVTVTDQALEVLVDDAQEWRDTPNRNLFIADWEETFRPYMDYTFYLNLGYPVPHAFGNSVLIGLDRLALIHPLDIQASLTRLESVESDVNDIASRHSGHVTNILKYNVNLVTEEAQNLLLIFLDTSIPIFFIALYLGVTISDTTFDLRRRETGLLLTKGARRPTILHIFLTESLLIGLVAGFVSTIIAILITPLLLGTQLILNPLTFFSVPLIIFNLIFAIVISLISVYSSAQHASRIPTIEALREYSATSHPSKYNRDLVWFALIIGTYKIIIWLAGINPTTLIPTMVFPSLILQVIFSAWFVFDIVTTPFAVLLFLYGFSKVLIQGTQIINGFTEKIMRRVMGNLGDIVTRSMRRNPARTAAVVFILSLVIGYGVQTLTVLASEEDYTIRSFQAEVGSDIAASIVPASKAHTLIPSIENISGVESVTAEYWKSLFIGPLKKLEVRAINASQWPRVSYYEESWFSIVSSKDAFEALRENKSTIIIQQEIAQSQEARLGETIIVRSGNNFTELTVGGFFGPAIFPDVPLSDRNGYYSLVNIEFLEFLGIIDDSNARLLIKTKPQANISHITTQLKEYSEISTIDSLQQELEEYSLNPIFNAPRGIMRLEVFFSFLLASMGTIIIITSSLNEKEFETSLMIARGSSFRQTALLLLGETTIWIAFSLMIGMFAGMVASNSVLVDLTRLDPFIERNLSIVISPAVFTNIAGIIILLIVSTIIPVLRSTRHSQGGVKALRQG